MGVKLQAQMLLLYFYTIKHRIKSRDHNNWWMNNDVMNNKRKLNILTFNQTSNGTTIAWVQNLDIHFQLKPMSNSKAILYSTLHLEGKTH